MIQKTINIADAKKHFSDLLGRVAYGKEQIIFSWRKGSKDSRGQGFKGLFSKNFISVFDVLSLSAISFFYVKHPDVIPGCFSSISFCYIFLP